MNADGTRLVQALTNLIANAIECSPSRSTVHAGCEQLGHTVLFTVSDHGHGIAAEKLETIFEPFEQVDSSDSRRKSGTGLGLSICRNIIEQHGGRIWVRASRATARPSRSPFPAQRMSSTPLATRVLSCPTVIWGGRCSRRACPRRATRSPIADSP